MASSFIHEVADAYDKAPVLHMTDATLMAWHELAIASLTTADRIKGCMQVSYTPHAEPYATAYNMLRDIGAGRIVVSTAHSQHPVWTLEENTAFRLVHDVVGHGTTGSGFDWAGELRAYEKHWSIVGSALARAALFTEAVGQVAYALTHGGVFTAQKVALLPQWMQYHIAHTVEVAA